MGRGTHVLDHTNVGGSWFLKLSCCRKISLMFVVRLVFLCFFLVVFLVSWSDLGLLKLLLVCEGIPFKLWNKSNRR